MTTTTSTIVKKALRTSTRAMPTYPPVIESNTRLKPRKNAPSGLASA
jgi:hypothetical protein